MPDPVWRVDLRSASGAATASEARKPVLAVRRRVHVRALLHRAHPHRLGFAVVGPAVNEWVSAVVFLGVSGDPGDDEPPRAVTARRDGRGTRGRQPRRSSLPLIVWVDVGKPSDEVGDALAEIVLDDVWKVYPDGTVAVRAPRPRHRRQGVRRPRRTVGLRQDDRAADDRRARVDHRRARCASVTASSTTCRRRSATSRWCSRTTRCIRT